MVEALKTVLGTLLLLFQSRSRLQLEILALRQQLIVVRRTVPKRAHLRVLDRLLFVRALSALAWRLESDRRRPTRHDRPLAPAWFQSLLVVEVSAPPGQTRHSQRCAGPDPRDQPRHPLWGAPRCHVGVAAHPTAEWLSQQISEASS
jgi:hypothetical protein